MNERESYYEIRDSECYRVTSVRTLIKLSDDALSRLSGDNGFSIRDCFSGAILGAGTGNVSLKARSAMTVYTIPLHKLPLRARFLIKDGILAPEFANKGPNSLHQAIQLEWLPVAGMRIFLMVTVSNTSIISAAKGRPVTSDQHLFAMDSAGRTYRLPTSNCFENCTLCTGIHRTDGASHIDCLNGAVNQFMTSEWQHDLAERGGVCSVQNSQSLFRYKPLEPDGFEQLPPLTADWTKYCVKVSNEFITSNMVVSND